jgi:protein-L-isoaspartate O-methyltransferase
MERHRAIDELELHLVELTNEPGLSNDVVALRDRLQRINRSMAQGLRERIAAASISPAELLATFRQYVRDDARNDLAYDDLDALVAGILSTDQGVDEGPVEADPEMVPYQPTPARLVLALLEEIRPTERDVFVDVGSGLGTVPILVSLLTRARSVGIEWHAGHCAYARACADSLKLSSVSFLQQDARAADFRAGTIFFMFTPFRGTMLRDVLRRLDEEGRRRPIRLCVYGPLLSEALREQPTFSIETGRAASISVFRSLEG